MLAGHVEKPVSQGGLHSHPGFAVRFGHPREGGGLDAEATTQRRREVPERRGIRGRRLERGFRQRVEQAQTELLGAAERRSVQARVDLEHRRRREPSFDCHLGEQTRPSAARHGLDQHA